MQLRLIAGSPLEQLIRKPAKPNSLSPAELTSQWKSLPERRHLKAHSARRRRNSSRLLLLVPYVLPRANAVTKADAGQTNLCKSGSVTDSTSLTSTNRRFTSSPLFPD